jgi:hypothetical protein
MWISSKQQKIMEHCKINSIGRKVWGIQKTDGCKKSKTWKRSSDAYALKWREKTQEINVESKHERIR